MTGLINWRIQLSGAPVLILMLQACQPAQPKTDRSSYKPDIHRLVFQNQSGHPLDDVRIYISATGEFASCGTILPGTECSNGFRLREYQGNYFDVSWKVNGQEHIVRNIRAELPRELQPARALRAVISFKDNNQMTAGLVF